jgi:hypothetical protein
LKKLIVLLLMFSLFETTDAQFKKVGRTSMQFVKIGIGARQSAMGEACIANLNDVNAIFWNPAALTQIDNIQAAFHYTKWIVDLNIMSAAVGFHLGNYGVLAVSYNFMNYGDLEEATVTSPTGGVDTRTGNIFSGKDLVFGVAYAKAFTDKLSIGVNVKYMREDLYKYTTSLWSFDVGSYYNTGWKGIRLAMCAQNFSTQARWLYTGEENRQSYEMPLLYRIGASIDLFGGSDLLLGGDPMSQKLTLNVDAIHSNDYSERVNIGAEYTFLNQFYLRGGYRINVDEGSLSMGLGVKTEISGLKLQVDYSYVNFDFLDSPHRVSVMLSL